MVEREGNYAEKRCAELWSTTVGRSREFAHLCGRFVRIKQIGHQTSYKEDMQETRRPPAAMMPLRAGWLILCSLLLASPAWSQRPGGPPGRYSGEKPAICTVVGTVTEAKNGTAIPFASVALMSMRDSSIVAGQLAGDDGVFSLTELPFGRYRLQVNFMGYAPFSSESIMLSPRTTTSYDAGTIALSPRINALEEAVVVEEASSLEMLIDRRCSTLEMTSPPPGARPANCWSMYPLWPWTSMATYRCGALRRCKSSSTAGPPD